VPDHVKMSKTLSYWLRHRPDAAGLMLDGGGWADVDAVLAALAREGLGSDWETLVQVVEQNDKQRFELSDDTARIRARQGHSVAVEGDWRPSDPPDLLYHGTVERFLEAIWAEGLKPMRRHHVHLSADYRTAERVGLRRGTPVVLTIEAGRLAATGQPFFLTGNGVWLTGNVSVLWIRR
jgi:putative RNA 2'-phosphotransferase